MKRLLPFLFIFVSIVLFVSVVSKTHEKIGQLFPGYLSFENGVVGAFYVPDWTGHTRGMKYHTIVDPEIANQDTQTVFTFRDYVLTCVLPAVTGLLFLLLGMGLCLYIPNQQGRIPLLFLHVLIGNYLILTPDFHLTHMFSTLLLILFALIPATAIHFSLLFPENTAKAKSHPIFYWLPYIFSFLLMIPYVGFFHHSKLWVNAEYAVFFYLVISYLFWVVRLYQTLKHPQLESNRIIARYLLLGQVIAFAIPLITSLAIFIGSYSFPLNFAAPFSLLFPISLFLGVILARLRQSQILLIQSEKNAALGNLLAGLAHEINNPMTFVYSSMEPLKELLASIKNKSTHVDPSWKDVDELMAVVDEGATRSKDIIESFRYFSHPDQKETQNVDLHAIIDQSVQLLKPKWNDRIQIVRHFGNIPLFPCQTTEMGQVFINLLSNACYAISGKGTIEIITSSDSSGIEISIKDSGRGMNREILSKIFDPFYTTKPQGDGTGLGLSITLGIVKKYNGTLDVKSEMGKGSEFILRLPVKS